MKIAFLFPECESLGVEYLSAALKLKGHKTKLFFDPLLFADQNFNKPGLAKMLDLSDEIIERVISYGPDVIAFSVLTPYYQWALKYAYRLKKMLNTPIIFGGVHPTAVPENVLEHEVVDFVICGEGEDALCELVGAIEAGDMNFMIDNVCYKKGAEIIKNPLRPLLEDLDALPFPDKDLFYDAACVPDDYSIMTGRGCPFFCSFCNTSYKKKLYKGKGAFVRKRTPENVIQELELAKKRYKSKMIIFDDELLTYDKKWLKKFSVLYEEKIDLMSFCWVSPTTIDEESVECLKRLKCYSVEMGVQTLNEEVRSNVLNRHYSNEQVENALRLFKKAKIKCIVEHIFGLPKETEQDHLKILDFYGSNKPDRISIYLLRYFPKTPIIEKAGLTDEQIKEINSAKECKPFTMGGNADKEMLLLYRVAGLLLNVFPHKFIQFLLENKMNGFLKFLGRVFLPLQAFLWFSTPLEYFRRWMIAGGIVIFRKISAMRYPLGVQRLIKMKITRRWR